MTVTAYVSKTKFLLPAHLIRTPGTSIDLTTKGREVPIRRGTLPRSRKKLTRWILERKDMLYCKCFSCQYLPASAILSEPSPFRICTSESIDTNQDSPGLTYDIDGRPNSSASFLGATITHAPLSSYSSKPG